MLCHAGLSIIMLFNWHRSSKTFKSYKCQYLYYLNIPCVVWLAYIDSERERGHSGFFGRKKKSP